jgi:hypothetical protein
LKDDPELIRQTQNQYIFAISTVAIYTTKFVKWGEIAPRSVWLTKKFSQSTILTSFSSLPTSPSPAKPSRPTSSQTNKENKKQLANILNLNIITAFNQLDIVRTAEIPLSPSESNSFLYQDNFKIAFKSKELDFFDPEFSEKYSVDNLIHSDKNTIYKNVHLFIERIRNIAKIKIPTIIQIYLFIYLRKTVLN